MTPPASDAPQGSPGPSGDPWQLLSLLITGVLVYGGAGWLADRWLGTSWIAGLGIVIGGGLGMYMILKRFLVSAPPSGDADRTDDTTNEQTASRRQEPPC